MEKSLYFDFGATTPLDPRVREAMLPFWEDHFGNSHSQTHSFGWTAAEAVEKARKQIALSLNCAPKEIYFTSGATESNNWAIRGLIDHLRQENPQEEIHVISSKAEHASVSKTLEVLQSMALIQVDWVKVDPHGRVDIEDVKNLIRPNTKLISLMWVNNEVGTLNPVAEISALTREKKIYFHCDGTHAVGKVKIDFNQIQMDLFTTSGHKFYGPKGIGFLYIRGKDPHVKICPLIYGGGHERGYRAGTLNTPGAVGMGLACEIVTHEFAEDQKVFLQIRNLFLTELKKHFPKMRLNTHPEFHVPNVLSLTFLGCQVPPTIEGLAVSASSACQSGATAVSRVLKALGMSDSDGQKTLRISFGKGTSIQDAEGAIRKLKQSIRLEN